MKLYPGGSVWRRWDPHVHTPGTALNDQYRNWEEFLAAIEAQDEVKVLGVTDYLSLENYSILKEYQANGRIPNVSLLFPNLEFRIAPPSEKATAVNLHFIVSPDDPNHEREIRNALGRLKWKYGDNTYSCVRDQLIALGRAFDPSAEDEKKAYATGVKQFKLGFTELRDWYEDEHWLKRNSLVAVDAGKDGLSGFQTDSGWAAFRDELTRFSQILFSGRPGEREFWLGEGSDENQETVARLGGPRPCLHGSDAHEMGRLFKPDGERYCWVKADPTFEGLRQVLYEPGDRVHIGPSPPIFHDEARVIRSVRLSNSDGWFDEIELPLNAGLVSIIGQKGSGKSALAEMISYASGSWDGEESGSFLRRAKDHIRELKVDLTWADGSVSEVKLGDAQPEDGAVRYLSQKFVERLCADDHLGEELVREIESVIFSCLDPTDTLNASSFSELRSIRTAAITAEGSRLREEMVRIIGEECALRVNRAKLADKRKRIETLKAEKDGLAKQLPEASTPEEAQLQTKLQERRNALNTAQRNVATAKQQLQKISDIRGRVAAFSSQMARFHSEIERLLEEAGIAGTERGAFKPVFESDTEPPLVRRSEEVSKTITALVGTDEDPAEGTVRWLERDIQGLVAKETADKARQEKVEAIQKRSAEIDVEVERIEGEIGQIEGPEQKRIEEARKERLEAYAAWFKNLGREQSTLEELYRPVEDKLAQEHSAEQELEFSIRWEADIQGWIERGGPLFDQRKSIPYGTMVGLADAARRILGPAWTSGEPEQVSAAMQEFLEEFRKQSPASYMRSGVTIQDVYEWLFEVDHIRLNYGLKYNGVELEKLSPGTKGIVLLILYLGMDVADTRPLIVDQPDENLDNESIYELLTAYFKTAKKRRQVIIITHNPNLVVNADSEQVIIATCDRRENGLPHIRYRSGSLEHTVPGGDGTREHVCRILEGGSDAFRKREKRYALPRV